MYVVNAKSPKFVIFMEEPASQHTASNLHLLFKQVLENPGWWCCRVKVYKLWAGTSSQSCFILTRYGVFPGFTSFGIVMMNVRLLLVQLVPGKCLMDEKSWGVVTPAWLLLGLRFCSSQRCVAVTENLAGEHWKVAVRLWAAKSWSEIFLLIFT